MRHSGAPDCIPIFKALLIVFAAILFPSRVGGEDAPAETRTGHLIEEAVEMAWKIPREEDRNGELQRIAWVVGPLDFQRALSIIEQILDEAWRMTGYDLLARNMTKVDVEKAIIAANRIAQPRYASIAFYEISTSLLETAPGRSLELGEKITDSGKRDSIFVNVACMSFKNEVPAALVLAKRIVGKRERAGAITCIALQMSRTDVPKALALVGTIPDAEAREEGVGAIAVGLAGVRLDDALKLVRRIKDPAIRGSAQSRIALVLAQDSPDRGLLIARSIAHVKSRGWALWQIGEGILKADLNRAMSLADEIEEPHYRAWLLISIARVLAREHPQDALPIYETAVKAARKVEDPNYQHDVFDPIIEDLMSLDLDRAIALATEYNGPGQASWVYRKASWNLAPSDPLRALTVAELISVDWEKAAALSGVAPYVAKIDPQLAISTLLRALKIGEELYADQSKEYYRKEVAIKMAELDMDRTLAMLDKIKSPEEKAEALRRIGHSLCKRNPALGQKFFGDAIAIARENQIPSLLATVAVDLFEAGRTAGVATACPPT